MRLASHVHRLNWPKAATLDPRACLAGIAIAIIFLSSGIVASTVRVLAEPPESPRLTIGFVLPLSGEWASLGSGIRDAAVLAKEDLEKDGFPVRIVFEDNHGDLNASATIGNRLLATEKVDAFVSIISGVGQVLKPLAERGKVINVMLTGRSTLLSRRF